MFSKALFHTALILFALHLEGCSQEQKNQGRLEALVFTMVDSLLSERIEDSVLSISYRPPKGWQRLSQALLDTAMRRGTAGVQTSLRDPPRIRTAFVEATSRSVFVASKVDSFDVSDSSASVRKTIEFLQRKDPTSDIRSALFTWGPFRVHQIMAIATTTVSVKMIFDLMQPGVPVFAWDFEIPTQVYPDMARTVESVVGSLQVHRTIH